MKKVIALFLSLIMIISFAACGKEEKKPGAYVLLYDGNGNPVVNDEFVEFKDYDEDGKIIVDELLKAAHEKYNSEGINAYGSEVQDYGLCITKLWGDESYSWGYYLNNGIIFNVEPEVKDGDILTAFVYQDPTGFSDVLLCFEKCYREVKKGEEITEKLSYIGFDESFNSVKIPYTNATVYLDGDALELDLPEDGSFKITGLEKGEHILTAKTNNGPCEIAICKILVK